MLTKRKLRAKIQGELSRQSERARDRRSRVIRRKLSALEGFRRSKCVCFYVSLPSEVDTRPMIKDAIKSGKKVLVPLVDLENKELKLYAIKNLRLDLKKGAFGIFEPRPKRARPARPRQVDCIVVPGIAFDRRCQRLGRGMGFYDRLLKQIRPEAVRIGLAFSFQVISVVPTQRHDQPLDLVLTD